MSDGTTSPGALPARVLILCLDMGDADLIRRWSGEGHLPHLAALSAEGRWWDLESPAEILHTSTWPTFATGVQPGRHGVYYPLQPRPGEQRPRRVPPTQYAAPTFWSLADRQARKCLVYDVPETFPSDGFSGRAIFEWGTWAWYGERQSQPESLIGELKTRFGEYPLKLEATRLGLKRPDPSVLERRLLRSVEHKAQSLAWLLAEEPWDLAVAGFCETHPAGHYLWPPDGRADRADGRGFAALRRIYAAIDRAIGTLRDTLPPGTALLVTSGDGVRANHCGWHLLPEIMERFGYAVRPGGSGSAAGRQRLSLRSVKNALPPTWRRWVADRLPPTIRQSMSAHLEGGELDWGKTRAFTLPTDLEGYVRINLQGREPQGIVAPEEYDALCREIAARLSTLADAEGRPIVKDVWIRNEVFPGAAREHLPDLIVTWNGDRPVVEASARGIGKIRQPSPDPRSGTHSPRAFLLAAGPGIAGGQAQASARLVDVAPTVLALLGMPAGATDGRSLVGPHHA